MLDDLLDADTLAYLAQHPSARAQLALVAQLLAATRGRLAGVAGRCPRCGEEDGLQVLFVATTARVRCIRCRQMPSLSQLLTPAVPLTEREQLKRIMTTRPKPAGRGR